MSRSAADIVLLSSTRETLFIGPLSAFPVQAREVMLRDRLTIREALRQFLSRPGAEETVRPYLRRWGIDAVAMRTGGRHELAGLLAHAAFDGRVAVVLASEPVIAFARTGEDFDARAALTLARGSVSAALPDDFLDRLFIVAGMVPDHMEGAVKQEFEALIENGYAALLISLVAMMIPGVNLAILGMSLFTLPGQILEAIDKLVAVLEDVRVAKSAKELERAAITAAAVLAILLREGILRRFLSAKFVAKGMVGLGNRFRKPTPKKTAMRQPQPKKSSGNGNAPFQSHSTDEAQAASPARDVSKKKRWGPATGAGPLGEDVAKTFRGGSYTEMETTEAVALYRVYGGKAGELGSYWTKTPPGGPLQSRIDSALEPKWGNTMEKVTKITVPKGTTIYDGFAAPQGGLLGGGSQVIIPKVDPSWVQK